MFLALVATTIAAMLVLLWCYWLNRDQKSLLWTALGFLLGATATFLMAGRGAMPDWLAVGVGAGFLILGASFLAIAARAFNHQPLALWQPALAIGIWAVMWFTPLFADADLRVVVLSLLTGGFYLLAARIFAERDGLRTRLPLAIVLAVHGSIVVLRIPLILTDGTPGLSLTSAGWFGLAMLEAVIFILLAAFLVVTLTKERVEARLHAAAHTDQLTGLGNRRAFFERGEAAIALASRNGNPLAVVVFDLDRFKDINDRHGHPVGDAVIQAFARATTKRLRGGDFIARVGGEEFAALLPDTDGAHAALVALQINQAFEAAVDEMGHPGLAGTACAGVAHLSNTLPTLPSLLSAADRALYEAKALGRGQVRRSITVELDARAA
jgi:diguanylate cyclase (GGDEF)-like protein